MNYKDNFKHTIMEEETSEKTKEIILDFIKVQEILKEIQTKIHEINDIESDKRNVSYVCEFNKKYINEVKSELKNLEIVNKNYILKK